MFEEIPCVVWYESVASRCFILIAESSCVVDDGIGSKLMFCPRWRKVLVSYIGISNKFTFHVDE